MTMIFNPLVLPIVLLLAVSLLPGPWAAVSSGSGGSASGSSNDGSKW